VAKPGARARNYFRIFVHGCEWVLDMLSDWFFVDSWQRDAGRGAVGAETNTSPSSFHEFSVAPISERTPSFLIVIHFPNELFYIFSEIKIKIPHYFFAAKIRIKL
jgi:hypothetical protein